MLVATAVLYGRVINTIGFEPELHKDEIGAIATAADECIKRYGADYQHWPAVMLVMALTAPVAVRMPLYLETRKRKAMGAAEVVAEQATKPQPKPPKPEPVPDANTDSGAYNAA